MPTIERQIEELEAAGWKAKTATIWRDPRGTLFRGPHGAWEIMRRNDPVIVEAARLADAWKRYRDLFGDVPHGTVRQMAALLELVRKVRVPPAEAAEGESR